MAKPSDPVLAHFRSLLTAVERADGNRKPTIAKGDCCIMLQLVRMKLDDFNGEIDPANPGRFRATAVLTEDMRRVLGDVPTFHVTKWGASHMRGALRADEKRGNKRHLIVMIGLLNKYQHDPNRLRVAYDHCIRAHHDFWEEFSITVSVQRDDPFHVRLFRLLDVASQGRVQQGIVYAALRRCYGEEVCVTTKKTFAGDAQSSQGARLQRGDVQVSVDGGLLFAIEVKHATVDETAWHRVVATHGEHDYELFILGNEFRPRKLQRAISSRGRTFAIHLADFLMSVVFTTAAKEMREGTQVLKEIVAIYNDEFCDSIEQDAAIRIQVIEE